jgi:hypothetical protein
VIGDISTAIAALKSVAELIKLIGDNKVNIAVREKAFELKPIILSLQDENLSLQADKRELLQKKEKLEQQIARLTQWEADAARYELKEIATGVFAYAIKPESDTSEPGHWLCPNCYQSRQKSILQRGAIDIGGTVYTCLKCKAEIVDHAHQLAISIPVIG